MADFYGKMKEERARRQGVAPTYKVLSVDLMKQADREKAAAVASFVGSREEAYKLAGHEGFSFFELDIRGRVGLVRYNGVEVALLFHRQVSEREPFGAEPVPARVLGNPEDEWLYVDLLNTGASDVTKEKGIGDRLRQSIQTAQNLRVLYDAEKSKRQVLEKVVQGHQKESEDLRALREKVALQDVQLKALERDVESWKVEAAKQQQARREEKIKTVRELMPTFNTTWLAGEHRVDDQLYGIIRKQLTEGLSGIGVELIEPRLGERFDPELHHAIHSYPVEDAAVDTVVRVQKVGWRLVKGPVVEAAEVAVGMEKPVEVVADGATNT